MTGSPGPTHADGFWAELRRIGVHRLVLRPLSTCAALVWRTSALSPRHSPRARRRAAVRQEFAQVRSLLMAVEIVFLLLGAIPLAESINANEPWRDLLGAFGWVLIITPALAMGVTQIVGAWAAPMRLLERVSNEELGRQLDAIVWILSVLVGIALSVVIHVPRRHG